MTDQHTGQADSSDAWADSWSPEACTLPTVERPLRVAEFDELFASSLRGVQRLAETRLLLTFDPRGEEKARDLTARESECCSFFAFSVTRAGDELQVEVKVPPAQLAVLDALAARAAARRTAAA